MNAPDIAASLRRLSGLRPVFHSEADFMHAFAADIGAGGDIRLERALPTANGPIVPDIWLLGAGGLPVLVIEVKYKTAALNVAIDGETFSLAHQAAYPLGHYDFLLDIQRLEGIRPKYPDAALAAVLLTNAPGYWTPPKRETVDAAFRVYDGRTLKGTLDWAAGTAAGTKKTRENPIRLKGTYHVIWRDYSAVDGSRFRYVLLEV